MVWREGKEERAEAGKLINSTAKTSGCSTQTSPSAASQRQYGCYGSRSELCMGGAGRYTVSGASPGFARHMGECARYDSLVRLNHTVMLSSKLTETLSEDLRRFCINSRTQPAYPPSPAPAPSTAITTPHVISISHLLTTSFLQPLKSSAATGSAGRFAAQLD